jgi:hypothetical protein
VYDGRAISHFELYLEAMRRCGADTRAIEALMRRVSSSGVAGLKFEEIPSGPWEFVRSTFGLLESRNLAAMAAAFTFGREDIIPDMFRAFVRDLGDQGGGDFSLFTWYLERHIEVDGDDHGPLALRMVADLCGSDERLWNEAADAAEAALKARLRLWDSILGTIQAM